MELCSICNEYAHHSTQSGENTSWLCCEHYHKLYKPKERCDHNEYITEDHGMMHGRRVIVSYKITTREEAERIQKQITRIVMDGLRKRELEKYMRDNHKSSQ